MQGSAYCPEWELFLGELEMLVKALARVSVKAICLLGMLSIRMPLTLREPNILMNMRD